MFLEQPQSTTVNETETATFRCAVVNSFSVFWWVNGSDAGYSRFRDRGIAIIVENEDNTRSRLEVAGHTYNNNTRVECLALRLPEAPIISDVALLIIKCKLNSYNYIVANCFKLFSLT